MEEDAEAKRQTDEVSDPPDDGEDLLRGDPAFELDDSPADGTTEITIGRFIRPRPIDKERGREPS